MRIEQRVSFRGGITTKIEPALMDTGATITIIPMRLAVSIGAWQTGQSITIEGIHDDKKTLPLGVADVFFPQLQNVGGRFPVAISDKGGAIIGMDIMKLLGMSIDTKTKQVIIKNEMWEAFKVLSAMGALLFGGIIVLGSIFGENK